MTQKGESSKNVKKRRSELANKVHKAIDKFGPLIYKNFKDDWYAQKFFNLLKSHQK